MKNLEFNYKNSLVDEDFVDELLKKSSSYTERLKEVISDGGYKTPESFINLPFDTETRDKVKSLADKKSGPDLKYLVIVGIGGSSLGAEALYSALRGNLDPYKNNIPKMIFADTVDPSLIRDIRSILEYDVDSKEEFLITVISKSGTTTETIANFETLFRGVRDQFGDVRDRVVAITEKNSKLWNKAKDRDVSVLEIPDKVGGRFSVFSPVGLFPLYLAGFNVDNLLNGAKDITDKCISGESKNVAAISASALFYHSSREININDSFFFDPDLEGVGKWYRQLMGESINKEYDLDGERVNAGITPTVSIGSTDLHSMAQAYFGGPGDKFTNLVYTKTKDKKPVVPEDPIFEDLSDGIYGMDMRSIMDAIYQGVKKTYEKKKLPFIEIILEDIDEYSLGAFMQFRMIEIVYLANFMGVNAFDQPSVEGYKKETKSLLRS